MNRIKLEWTGGNLKNYEAMTKRLFSVADFIEKRIKTCPECSCDFYRTDKRSQFCSRSCTNRQGVRVWRRKMTKDQKSTYDRNHYLKLKESRLKEGESTK